MPELVLQLDPNERVIGIGQDAAEASRQASRALAAAAIAEDARDAALAVANFIPGGLATAEAATSEGDLFSYLNDDDELVLARRTDVGSVELETYFGADHVGVTGGGSVQDWIDRQNAIAGPSLPEVDGAADQAADIQAVIDAAAVTAGIIGGKVMVKGAPGTYALASPIIVKQGVILDARDCGFKAIALMNADNPMIQVESNAFFGPCYNVDANHRAKVAVGSIAAEHGGWGELVVNNWQYGWYVANNTRSVDDFESNNMHIGRVVFGPVADDAVSPDPGFNVVYAGWFRSRNFKQVWDTFVGQQVVVGLGIDYAVGNRGLADIFEYQSSRRCWFEKHKCWAGGEIGIAVARLSEDCDLVAPDCRFNDGPGVQMGSAFGEGTVDNVTNLAEGDLLYSEADEASAVIDRDGFWDDTSSGSTVHKLSLTSMFGQFSAGATLKQAIAITVDDARAFEESGTVSAAGGKGGDIVRIIGLNRSEAADRIFVAPNGVDTLDFEVGDTIDDGNGNTQVIRKVSQSAGVTSDRTLVSFRRSSNLRVHMGISCENSRDYSNKYWTMTVKPELWRRGDTVTWGGGPGSGGGSADIWNVESIVISVEDIQGNLPEPGDTLTNGTDSYELRDLNGYAAGYTFIHVDGCKLISSDGFDLGEDPTQKFHAYFAHCSDIDIQVPGNPNNVFDKFSFNGKCTFVENDEFRDTFFDGLVGLNRGPNLWVDSGQITPTHPYHHISGTTASEPTQSASTIDNIVATKAGQLLLLSPGLDGNNLTLEHGTTNAKNIRCPGEVDLVLTKSWQRVLLVSQETSAGNFRWSVVTANVSGGGGGETYATIADVDSAVADLVDTAPSTLDTLNELAAALGDDPNFATTVTNALAAKAPLAPRIQSVTSAGTVTPTFLNDQVNITAQATGLTLANPTGTAVSAHGIAIRIKDNGTARAISYGAQYRAIGVTLPTTTVANKTLYLGMVFNSADTKWDVVAVAQEA
tara:strand:+ start:14506 stop:17442 length:2937 start_codon:yes stop_codon:yes gene_type:complete